MFRDVAQFGSALRSGRRGRRFKSCHPEFFQTCSSAGSHEITILINWILRIVAFPMYGCKTHSSSTATQNPVIPIFYTSTPQVFSKWHCFRYKFYILTCKYRKFIIQYSSPKVIGFGMPVIF